MTAPATPATAHQIEQRRHGFDVLRVAACFAVVTLHSLAPFASGFAYHVQSGERSLIARIALEALLLWSMPTFFFIAGWSARSALAKSTMREFLANRIRRLAIPLLLGFVFLTPVIKYFELRSGIDLRMVNSTTVTPLEAEFSVFVRYYFTHSIVGTWSHLWFLIYLGLITLAALPWLRQRRRIKSGFDPPVPSARMMLAPAALLAFILVAGEGWWPYYPNLIGDLGNLVFFAAFFGIGAYAAARPQMLDVLGRVWIVSAVTGVLTFAVAMASMGTPLGRAAVAVAAWGMVAATVGVSARAKPWPGRPPSRLSRATLPFYVLHHPFVVGFAFAALEWDMPWPAAVALILAGALIATSVFYILIVVGASIGREIATRALVALSPRNQ